MIIVLYGAVGYLQSLILLLFYFYKFKPLVEKMCKMNMNPLEFSKEFSGKFNFTSG